MNQWLRAFGFALVPAVSFIGSTAHAAGIDLAWNNCLPGPGSAVTMPFACNDDVTAHRLVGSFVPPDGVDQFVGQQAILDLVFPDGPEPDWWMMGASECREGAITVDANFSGLSGCARPWGGSPIAVFNYTSHYGGDPRRARLEVLAARSTPIPLSSGSEYYGFEVTIAGYHTTAADPPACAGCPSAVCIFLGSIQLYQPEGVGNIFLTNPLQSNFASWQCATWGIADPGGIITCMSENCPVPARRRSWGQVRTLYR